MAVRLFHVISSGWLVGWFCLNLKRLSASCCLFASSFLFFFLRTFILFSSSCSCLCMCSHPRNHHTWFSALVCNMFKYLIMSLSLSIALQNSQYTRKVQWCGCSWHYCWMFSVFFFGFLILFFHVLIRFRSFHLNLSYFAINSFIFFISIATCFAATVFSCYAVCVFIHKTKCQ